MNIVTQDSANWIGVIQPIRRSARNPRKSDKKAARPGWSRDAAYPGKTPTLGHPSIQLIVEMNRLDPRPCAG